jgi:hypothetical protein
MNQRRTCSGVEGPDQQAQQQARRSVWAPDCPVGHAVVVHKPTLPLEADDPQGAAHHTPAWGHDGPDQQHLGMAPTSLEKERCEAQDHRGEAGGQAKHGGVSCGDTTTLADQPAPPPQTQQKWPKSS